MASSWQFFFAKQMQFRVVQIGPWPNLQTIHGYFFFVTKGINHCIVSFNGDHSQSKYWRGCSNPRYGSSYKKFT